MRELVAHEPPVVDGYWLVERYTIPIRRASLIGLLSAPGWIALYWLVGWALGGTAHLTIHVTLLEVAIALLDLTIVMPVVHEAIHGVAALMFGARPTFGVGSGFAYTTFQESVRPIPYLVIGLAPLVVISVVEMAVLVHWPFAPGQTLVFLVGNACGAVGDLWVAGKVHSLPRASLVCDLADGFAHYLPTPASDGVALESDR